MSNEFEAWKPQEPPAGFADRVLAADDARRRVETRRRWAAGTIGAVALAAGLALWWRGSHPATGEVIARERREVALDGAVAVLEAGARIRWQGERVEQTEGEVFYRVDHGHPYAVVTPAGTVDVGGTCFRVKVDPIDGTNGDGARVTPAMKNSASKVGAGIVAGALMTVGVYEGRVRVSRAGEQRTLTAGESTTIGAGTQTDREASGASGSLAGASARPGASSEDARMAAEANRNLTAWVQRLSEKISATEEQKKALERQLGEAQAALDRANGKDSSRRSRNEYDLDQEDWKALAEKGIVKFHTPCMRKSPWQPDREALTRLGLGPDDAPALTEVYQQSNARVWSTIRPLCVAALGGEAAVDRLGPDTCMHLILDTSHDKERETTSEAMRQVGEVRAGLRTEPSEAVAQSPVYQMFAALTDEAKLFEADLTKHFGPDEAHRLAFADGMCFGGNTFSGPGPREPKKSQP